MLKDREYCAAPPMGELTAAIHINVAEIPTTRGTISLRQHWTSFAASCVSPAAARRWTRKSRRRKRPSNPATERSYV